MSFNFFVAYIPLQLCVAGFIRQYFVPNRTKKIPFYLTRVAASVEIVTTSWQLVKSCQVVSSCCRFVNIKWEWSSESTLSFQQQIYEAAVVENSTKIATVVVVAVLGAELNEHVLFSLLNPSPQFQISRTSGAIRTTGLRFDRETQDYFQLIVQVSTLTAGLVVCWTRLLLDHFCYFHNHLSCRIVKQDNSLHSNVRKANCHSITRSNN